jgi:uroporphyrinogen III methyltransferase/synthase
MSDERRGVVFLVGAGPGDPGLLTVRARELLHDCDVVAHDELCSDALLAAIPAHVELVSVGRRGHGAGASDARGASEGRRDYRLHPLVLELARAGKRVVRLKAGDPFVFGRGGEEAEELRQAGIAFEIVPGVSAALGAAAYAGIPLTHRHIASDVTLATGHDLGHDTPGGGSDWPLLARGRGTIVLFMAARRLAENVQRLVEHGRDPGTPAAYVAAATTARQRVIVAPLSALADRVKCDETVDPQAPALIIVGEVARLRETLGWIEARRLWGKRVLVARARPGRSEIAAALAAAGAEVLEAPTLSVAPPAHWAPLDRALVEAGAFAGLVFACAEGAEAALARLMTLGRDLRALPRVPIIAVGERAAVALRGRGIVADVVARGACRDALAERAELALGHLLVIAGEEARPRLRAELTELGATVTMVAAYRLARRLLPLAWRDFDLVIAPSSTAAQQLGDGPQAEILRAQRWLAMGPHAEAAVRRLGVAEVARAPHDDVASIVAAAMELLS